MLAAAWPLHVAAGNVEDGEEREDIGDDHDEIGDRQPENRNEILPQGAPARAVAPDLRHGVLREDVDADPDDQQPADDAQDGVVLLDLALKHRVEEERRHSHEGVGAGDPDARDDARTPVLGERALDAEHRHGADGNRRRDAHADAAEEEFGNFE